ncbi:MAG: hypothetical protein ABSA59_16830 [Terriglobia bacterium]|jgi:hypothetical protein
MTRNDIMDFKFGKSIQVALLIVLAFSCAARAQEVGKTYCEAKVASMQNYKITAAGTVISFTGAPGPGLDAEIEVYGDEEHSVGYKTWGCTEALFISDKTGEIVKRIDLKSLDSKGRPTPCEEWAASRQAEFSKDPNDILHLHLVKVTAAGTRISFTAPPGIALDSVIRLHGDEREMRGNYAVIGCTETLFISAETGEIVKRIYLGPAESKVAADEKGSLKPAVSSIKQIEEPTAENINNLLDLTLGFYRRELAVLRELQNWYEVDPHHPDAVALGKEYCANLNTNPGDRFLAVTGLSPEDDARSKKAHEAIEKSGPDAMPEYSEKLARYIDLFHKTLSARKELEGMGFSCGQ